MSWMRGQRGERPTANSLEDESRRDIPGHAVAAEMLVLGLMLVFCYIVGTLLLSGLRFVGIELF